MATRFFLAWKKRRNLSSTDPICGRMSFVLFLFIFSFALPANGDGKLDRTEHRWKRTVVVRFGALLSSALTAISQRSVVFLFDFVFSLSIALLLNKTYSACDAAAFLSHFPGLVLKKKKTTNHPRSQGAAFQRQGTSWYVCLRAGYREANINLMALHWVGVSFLWWMFGFPTTAPPSRSLLSLPGVERVPDSHRKYMYRNGYRGAIKLH